jgi:phosphatidylglycerol:prolipoprotein diacylglycerol transferase
VTPVLPVPFLHTAWLLAAGGGTWAALSLLPAMRARWLIGAAIGIGLATALSVGGVIPWRGQLHLALYGLCMLGSFLIAYVLLSRRCEAIGVPERALQTLMLVAMVAGLAGARARYVWERPQEFTVDRAGHALPFAQVLGGMVDFDSGGMVWYGGLSLATIAVALVAWRKGFRLFALADIVAPALLAGLAVGRIGCFLNGCCYGRVCDLPWAVPHPLFVGVGEHQVMVHPTQLYETLVCSLIAAALWWYWRRRRVDGVVTFLGVIAYGIWRFVNEGLRGDDRIPSTWLGLPAPGSIDMTRVFSLPLDTSQVTSIQLIVGALVAAVAVAWYRARTPAAAQAAHAVPGSIHAPVPAPATTPAAAADAAAPGVAVLPTRAH